MDYKFLFNLKQGDVVECTHYYLLEWVPCVVIQPPQRKDGGFCMKVKVLASTALFNEGEEEWFYGVDQDDFRIKSVDKAPKVNTQYIDLCKRIIDEGEWVEHKRSGKKRKTVIGETFTYDVGAGEFPIDTTRKSFWKAAVAEMWGYLKGYSNAHDFASLRAPTWLANANENDDWRNNPARKGSGDMGLAYRFREYNVGVEDDEVFVDQYKDIVDNLLARNDNARLIMTAWQPHFDDYACLPACMHTHTFSLLGDTLHLTSYQRSVDVPLGLNFNMIQCYFLLAITAQITGLKAGKVQHHMVNCHIYEDQIDLMKEQVKREPYPAPKFKIDPFIKSLHDLGMMTGFKHFNLEGYQHHEAINYPFTV